MPRRPSPIALATGESTAAAADEHLLDGAAYEEEESVGGEVAWGGVEMICTTFGLAREHGEMGLVLPRLAVGVEADSASPLSPCEKSARQIFAPPPPLPGPLPPRTTTSMTGASPLAEDSSTPPHPCKGDGWRFPNKSQDITYITRDAQMSVAMNLTKGNSGGGVHCVRLLTVS